MPSRSTAWERWRWSAISRDRHSLISNALWLSPRDTTRSGSTGPSPRISRGMAPPPRARTGISSPRRRETPGSPNSAVPRNSCSPGWKAGSRGAGRPKGGDGSAAVPLPRCPRFLAVHATSRGSRRSIRRRQANRFICSTIHRRRVMNRRTMSALRHFAVAALLALAWGLSLLPAAQAQTTGGNLIGKVQDKSGAALPGATITATQKETGLTRNTVSEADGKFRLPSLPAGTYTVQVELNGFATATSENVTINVATQREITFDLNTSTVAETINVVAEAPLVQTTPAVGAVIDQKQIENLPLNGRQFANLAVLAPGTSLNYNSDPTKPGQLTVALNSVSGLNVKFVVDGGDNMDDTIGGALHNFNLDRVQQLNIQTQQYKAEYGRSTGGVLTVVTKTGTNQIAGGAWGFFRKDSLNSESESEKVAGSGKSSYDRKQYGASLGGPIVKDKVHYFATYEKTDRKTAYIVHTDPDGPSKPEQPTFPQLQGQAVHTPL